MRFVAWLNSFFSTQVKLILNKPNEQKLTRNGLASLSIFSSYAAVYREVKNGLYKTTIGDMHYGFKKTVYLLGYIYSSTNFEPSERDNNQCLHVSVTLSEFLKLLRDSFCLFH